MALGRIWDRLLLVRVVVKRPDPPIDRQNARHHQKESDHGVTKNHHPFNVGDDFFD